MSGGVGATERQRIRERLALERGLQVSNVAASVCMAYPSPYRVGMSSLGFQTLYRLLNAQGMATHRAFLPDEWERAALTWPQPKRPILSYEAQRPISDYPILAISVAYELEVTGVIRLLTGAGIPLLARDRGPRDPIVIGGGPLTFSNPSTLLPFVDAMILGEAEALLPDAVGRILASHSRAAALVSVAELPHTIVPPEDFESVLDLPTPARADHALLPAYSAIVTPEAELSDMFLVEPERGCSRQCTFCVMRGSSGGGMRLLPMATPLAVIPEHARRVGLVGAAVTDHPELEALVAAIVESGRGIGISSVRADRLTPTLLRNLAQGGYRQITAASDGISERMRQLLSRKIKEESLLRAAKLVAEHDFLGLKLYEMIGAPGETDDDVDELIRFASELAKIVRLTLTFSTFVAKRNTPLDGQPFIGVKQSEARLARIRSGLRGRVELRPQSSKWAYVEYELAQRGAEVGLAAVEAVAAGGRYGDWVRAFAQLPENRRPLRHGDEDAWARRKGKAARPDLVRTLPVIA